MPTPLLPWLVALAICLAYLAPPLRWLRAMGLGRGWGPVVRLAGVGLLLAAAWQLGGRVWELVRAVPEWGWWTVAVAGLSVGGLLAWWPVPTPGAPHYHGLAAGARRPRVTPLPRPKRPQSR